MNGVLFMRCSKKLSQSGYVHPGCPQPVITHFIMTFHQNQVIQAAGCAFVLGTIFI